ncbi:Receptor-like protein kinase ANXUR1 [Platanthera zijinensis]|uniref:non-specific serine/threonine protein kinase n=1 Tax=Platanthera zijinensis TaxID=2320716 RepID=A0AAP0BXX6_9ASPA
MILAVALGVSAAALSLVGVLYLLLYYRRRHINTSRTSEISSSPPSLQAEHSIEFSVQEGGSHPSGQRGVWHFSLEELKLATKNFSDVNLIGHGTFGEAYKGLLQDGTIVAVKKRQAVPSQKFIEEVVHLASIRHRNLVSLLGYCQESDMQMLIYDYIPNGGVSTHLYGASQESANKLEFKHRLSIAYGAAKGLDHLHSLSSPLVHMNFRTTNVLVDEDFISKVADPGVRMLLQRVDGVGSSRTTLDDPFIDPEMKELGRFSKKSDVYSFGVFLVELVSGREIRSEKSARKWVQNYEGLGEISDLVDQRMSANFTSECMNDFLQLIAWCLNASGERRPAMSYVASELERIRGKEMTLTTIMGEGTDTVTLGSQLFK